MPEQQNVEYKESWRDEYLKWVCGFANAQGGTIYIGLNDHGQVIGLANSRRLLEDIPNKINNYLGIVCDVDLQEDQDLPYLKIYIPPYQVPISYHGEYHYRSGSTKLVLRGMALQQFLLRKLGKTWDDVVEPRGTFEDLDPDAVQAFIHKASQYGRLQLEDGEANDITLLLNNLNLLEEGKLKRAALLLFGKKPTRFFIQADLKIGRFGKSTTDLLFQDVIEGNIFQMADKAIKVLKSKFLPAYISYQGLQRIERIGYPEAALREALLNAIAHRDYFGGSIQVSVYDDRLIISNPGKLPEDLSLSSLKQRHRSHPRNPTIANVFFKAGLIETWGRGTLRIIEECTAAGLPEPAFEEQGGGMEVTLFIDKFNESFISNLPINERQKKALLWMRSNGLMRNADYMSLAGVSRRTALRDLDDLIEKRLIVRVGATNKVTYRLATLAP